VILTSRLPNSTYLASKSNLDSTPLIFLSQPQSKTVDEYGLATFSCEVTGGVAPYSYQYKKNGANVGTDSSTLSFAAAATDNAASITVVVTDSAGTVITSAAATLGVTSYAFTVDGVTQYYQLSSSVSLAGDFVVSFNYKGSAGNYYPLIGRDDGTLLARIDNNGTLRVFVGSALITSTAVINNNVNHIIEIVRVGQVLTLKIDGVTAGTVNSSSTLGTVSFSRLAERLGSYTSGQFKKLIVSSAGVSTLNLPLNNKSQGANQIATVGSINATIVNYNAAGWTAL
jgi:hypothetical protein